MTDLTTREGDGDASRTGYWVVTGPQPEHEAYATIERSLITGDDTEERLAFAWYLHLRTSNVYNQSSLRQAAQGLADSFDAALSEVSVAWQEHVAEHDDEDTAEIAYPWRQN